jgi:hypothetical protein
VRRGATRDGDNDLQEGNDQRGLGCDRDHERHHEEGDGAAVASKVQPCHIR